MNKKLLIPLIALVLVVAAFVGIYLGTRPQAQEGAKAITVTVVHKDESVINKTIHTDAEYLSQALIEAGIVAEENIVDGFFDTVDGEKADFNVDGGWWALYKGDATTLHNEGITTTVIADGDSFRLVYTIGWA